MLQIDDVFLKKSQLSFVISEAIVESSLDLFISESISSCKLGTCIVEGAINC